MTIAGFFVALLVGAAVVAMLLAIGWCVFDVVFVAPHLRWSARVAWVVAMVVLNVWGAIAYVRFGPGADRWMMWREPDPLHT